MNKANLTDGSEFRSGFAALIGRPNTGKSTLLNEIVGSDIAISAKQAQTTRHVIRGIVTTDTFQLVLVDTPGFHRPRTLLGQRLTDLVKQTVSFVDLIVFCIPADEPIGPGDKFLLREATNIAPKAKIVGVVTKTDKVKPNKLMEQLQQVAEFLGSDKEIVPISAKKGNNIDTLLKVLQSQLKLGPLMYDPKEVTDEKIETIVAEYIREATLEELSQEIPHSVAVVLDEVDMQAELVKIYASVVLERDSQKAIVIGKKGEMLKKIGIKARKNLELLYDKKVFLSLHVKVEKNWQQNAKLLNKLGF